MIKNFIAVAISAAVLSGCSSDSTLSGDVYSSSQAKQIQTVTYGTVIFVRPVTIQGGDDSNIIGAVGGAVLGGFLGNTIGSGTGRNLATAAGVVAGGVAGQGIQSTTSRNNGIELEIRKENGTTVVVVQKQGPTTFSVGQRVMLATGGGSVTVTPR